MDRELERMIRDHEHAIEDHARAIRNHLRARGWLHTCNNAGNLWLWTREIPEFGRVAVDQDTAVSIQMRLD